MKAFALALTSLIAVAAFSGCLDDSGSPAGATTGSAATTTSAAADTTATTAPAENGSVNRPPIVVTKVLVNGTEVSLLNDSYAVPAGENVTLDASGSSDPEGSALSFAWELPGGNASSEASAVLVLAAGNHSVELSVSDPDGGVGSASLRLVALELSQTTVVAKTFEGTILVGTQGDGEVYSGCGIAYAEGEPGIDAEAFEWDLTAATSISQFTMEITQGDTGVDMDYYLYDPDGKEVAKSAGFEPLDGAEKGFTKDGEFAPGTYQVVVRGCTAVAADFTVEMTATIKA